MSDNWPEVTQPGTVAVPEHDLCPGCLRETCKCPSLEQVPFGQWHSDNVGPRTRPVSRGWTPANRAEPESPPSEGSESAHSWRRVDLAAVLDGSYLPPRATVGARDDGVGLFYPGRVHTVAGEAESLKTWFALHAASVELAAGNAVLYADFEDDEGGVVGRLLAIGGKPSDIGPRFAYVRPTEPVSALDNRVDLAEILADLRPTLAVVDGVTEAMALHGLELRDNTDVARFGKLLLRSIAEKGPAVVALDHVTKDRETRGRYAIGGVHKLNGVNGAAYVLENRRPFGIGLTGRSTVLIAKDRPGQLRRDALPSGEGLAWFADLEIVSHDVSFAEVSLAAPEGKTTPFRPTTLMSRVSEALNRASEALSQTGIEARVQGKAADIRTAVAALVDDGYVAVEPGPRGAKLHRLVRPYGEAA